jgi:hypothetical protein
VVNVRQFKKIVSIVDTNTQLIPKEQLEEDVTLAELGAKWQSAERFGVQILMGRKYVCFFACYN